MLAEPVYPADSPARSTHSASRAGSTSGDLGCVGVPLLLSAQHDCYLHTAHSVCSCVAHAIELDLSGPELCTWCGPTSQLVSSACSFAFGGWSEFADAGRVECRRSLSLQGLTTGYAMCSRHAFCAQHIGCCAREPAARSRQAEAGVRCSGKPGSSHCGGCQLRRRLCQRGVWQE